MLHSYTTTIVHLLRLFTLAGLLHFIFLLLLRLLLFHNLLVIEGRDTIQAHERSHIILLLCKPAIIHLGEVVTTELLIMISWVKLVKRLQDVLVLRLP